MTTMPQEAEPGQALALAEERTAPSPGTVETTEVVVERDPTVIEEKAEERDQAVAVVAV